MRKVQDFYYKKAKKDKYPARSIYKLEEAQHKYRFLRKGDSVLDLGCYPGSWSLYASEVVGPKGVVVGIDLKQVEQAPRAGGAEIHWLCRDINEEDLLAEVHRIRPRFKVLLSDMAPRTTGNRWADHQKSLRLCRRCLELATVLLHEQGHFFCKAFQGEDFPEFVDEVKAVFGQVRIFKPKSSRTESREVFVLGMKYQSSR
ncbi:MAG: RlmE family RNA methyltransferase [Thermodesulfobacteriota bacterium]